MSPQPHVFEYLVPSGWYCLGETGDVALLGSGFESSQPLIPPPVHCLSFVLVDEQCELDAMINPYPSGTLSPNESLLLQVALVMGVLSQQQESS